jgi:hypothetical protein
MRMIDETPTSEAQGASCPPPHQRVRSTLCRFAMPLTVVLMLALGVFAYAGAQ